MGTPRGPVHLVSTHVPHLGVEVLIEAVVLFSVEDQFMHLCPLLREVRHLVDLIVLDMIIRGHNRDRRAKVVIQVHRAHHIKV